MRKLLITLCVVLLLGAVWLLIDRGGETAGQAASPVVSGETAEHAARPGAVEHAVEQAQSAEAARREALGRGEAASLSEAVIEGRLLAAENDLPLAGCVLSLRGQPRERAARQGAAAKAWRRSRTVKSGADGRFALRFEPPPALRFSLRCTCAGRTSVRTDWPRLSPGQRIDLGDVRLPAAAKLVGRVIDEHGAPVVRVRLSLTQRALEDRRIGELRVKSFGYLRSGADGRLETRDTFPPGLWTIQAQRDFVLIRPKQIRVAENADRVELLVVVKPPRELPVIRGIVVDESGKPVARLPIVEGGPVSGHNRTTTDKAGRFTLRNREGREGKAVLGVDSIFREGYEVVGPNPPVAWGTEDVRLVVRRPQLIEVFVVEAGSGRPVPRYDLRCMIPPGSAMTSSLAQRLRHVRPDANGRATLSGIGRGKHRLIVYPEDKRLVVSEPLEFEVGARGASVTVKLHHRLPLTVQLRLPDGSEVSGSRVELLRRVGGRGKLEPGTITGTPAEVWESFFSSGPIGMVLDRGRTDAEGRVVLHGPPSRGKLYVKARGPGHVPLLRGGVVLARNQAPLVLTVVRGATLAGVLEPMAVLSKLLGREQPGKTLALRMRAPGIILYQAGGRRRVPPGYLEKLPLDGRGRFRADGVPAGRWDVHLSYEARLSGQLRGAQSRDEKLGTVTLTDGQEKELRFDVSHLRPGVLKGRILLDDMPAADAPFWLLRRAPEGSATGVGQSLHTDAEGRFRLELQAGLYQVGLMVSGQSIPGTERARVESGKETRFDFHLVRRTLRLRVLEPDGKPATTRRFFRDQSRLLHNAPGLATDADGWLTIDLVTPGKLWIWTLPRGLDRATFAQRLAKDSSILRRLSVSVGPIQVPAEGKQTKRTVTLPAHPEDRK